MSKPILSIGMIFKNEIRCLERCMKSLQPLRDAIPCELVMADTGSDDGSREVAAKYADILFDFPWIDDFAAARNAVMDRCSGQWYLGVDADEWMDENVDEIVRCLHGDMDGKNLGAIVIRNYLSADLKGDFGDFFATRMVRMSTGERYSGAIHEHWTLAKPDIFGLSKTIFHHDGYVTFSAEQKKAKFDRNMKLLRKQLEKEPENLLTLLQCIESSSGSWEYEGFVRRAVDGVKKRYLSWEVLGGPIMRYAVAFAESCQLPEEDEWIELANTLFPASPFTTIDVAYTTFFRCARKEDTKGAISAGERYLHSIENYRAGNYDVAALIYSSLSLASPSRENNMRVLLAAFHIQEGSFKRARELFEKVDLDRLSVGDTGNYLGGALNIHAQSTIDMSQTVTNLWEHMQTKGDAKRRDALLSAAGRAFTPEYRKVEAENGYRHAYTAFLPLAEKWGPGTAAAILEMDDPVEMEPVLAKVDNWNELPIYALSHALERGARFPVPGCSMNIEEMDGLAARLMREKKFLPLTARLVSESENVVWRRGLATAAVRAFHWADAEETELGMELAGIFAASENKFLSLCYEPGVLQKEKLFILPPMHRFGWYCAQAFEALDGGDTRGYVRHLRDGLTTCEGMKSMVEFLLINTPQLQAPKPSGELLALAEKVRTMLAAYDPSDPAVTMLKRSTAYQKVAHLIEGPEPGVFGGLAQ